MKIRLHQLKRFLRESLFLEDGIAPAGGTSLSKLLDDMAAQFSSKMQGQYPQAGDVITQEAQNLKTQLTAQIKASAAKVKMAAQQSS